MTVNNLDNHLAWLLRNVILSRPNIKPFPSITDSFSAASSQSQNSLPAVVPTKSQWSNIETSQSGAQPNRSRQFVDGYGLEEDAREEEALAIVEENMGRLTSTSSSKKPSLLTKSKSLVSVNNGHSRSDSDIDKPKLSSSSTSSATPSRSRKLQEEKASLFKSPIIDSDDDLDCMDLTGDIGPSAKLQEEEE